MEGEIRHWLSSPATQVALQDHCLVTKIVVGATTVQQWAGTYHTQAEIDHQAAGAPLK